MFCGTIGMNDFLCKKLVIRIEIFLKNLPSTKNWTGFYDDIVEASEKIRK